MYPDGYLKALYYFTDTCKRCSTTIGRRDIGPTGKKTHTCPLRYDLPNKRSSAIAAQLPDNCSRIASSSLHSLHTQLTSYTTPSLQECQQSDCCWQQQRCPSTFRSLQVTFSSRIRCVTHPHGCEDPLHREPVAQNVTHVAHTYAADEVLPCPAPP